MHAVPRRKNTAIGLVAAAGLALSGLAAIPAGAATGGSITTNDPGHPVAGTVVLTGNVSKAANEVTSVLYVVDVTASSKLPASGGSCGDVNHDGGAPPGAVGDVLDCELAAVTALNSSLLASSGGVGIQVGIEAFGSSAALADLSPAGGLFAPPGDTLAGETQPRIITAATSVQHHQIVRYNVKPLGTTGIDYNDVIATAQAAFATAPAGPKWVFLLSDGKTSVNTDAASTQVTLTNLHNSGIHLSTFAVGDNSNCNETGALSKLAAATGEVCTVATTPAGLATQLTGSQPDGISDVTVTIGSTPLPADIDPIGQWSVAFTLGAGSYTATATAHFALGSASTANRSFSVSAAPGGGGPAPGTVAPGPGALLATVVQVNQPAPSRAELPTVVTGSVGLPSKHSLVTTKKLEGATVLLQGRKAVGGTWVTVGHATVKAAKYSLHWKPTHSIHFLRVSLSAPSGLAASSTSVPVAHISSCTVTKHATSFSMTCHTNAAKGSAVRLYKGSHIVKSSHIADKAKVSGGLVKVHAAGKPGAYVLRVWLSKAHNAHHSTLAL
jgi:hypothetical protein